MVTIGDNTCYIRVLLYSYYTTITAWGGPPNGSKKDLIEALPDMQKMTDDSPPWFRV